MIEAVKKKWAATKKGDKKVLLILGVVILYCLLIQFGINIGSAIGKL